MRPRDQAREFVLIHPLERDGIDLDLQAGRLRGVNAGKDLVQSAPACDVAEFRRIERVERDIYAHYAEGREIGRILPKLRTVGRERQLVETTGSEVARECRKQRHDAAAHQRFAAGKAKLAYAARNEGGAQPVKLLERQQVRFRQEAHVLVHAVDAAEVAAICHRDPQVRNLAPERVDQRRTGNASIHGVIKFQGWYGFQHPRYPIGRHSVPKAPLSLSGETGTPSYIG